MYGPAREFVPLPSQLVINVADARSSGLILILSEQPLSISVNSTAALALGATTLPPLVEQHLINNTVRLNSCSALEDHRNLDTFPSAW